MSRTPATATPAPVCSHDNNESTRIGSDPVASAWECEDCGHLTPFTDADYLFCNTSPWTPPRPTGVDKLTWMFTPNADRLAHYARA